MTRFPHSDACRADECRAFAFLARIHLRISLSQTGETMTSPSFPTRTSEKSQEHGIGDGSVRLESGLASAEDWTGSDDPGCARNWSRGRRYYSTFVVGFAALVTTLTSAIYAPGITEITQEFGISTTAALVPLSVFNVGLAAGPVIGAPLSETFGRKLVYIYTMPFFAIFILGAGFTKNIGGLIICLLLAGVFARCVPSLSRYTEP